MERGLYFKMMFDQQAINRLYFSNRGMFQCRICQNRYPSINIHHPEACTGPQPMACDPKKSYLRCQCGLFFLEDYNVFFEHLESAEHCFYYTMKRSLFYSPYSICQCGLITRTANITTSHRRVCENLKQQLGLHFDVQRIEADPGRITAKLYISDYPPELENYASLQLSSRIQTFVAMDLCNFHGRPQQKEYYFTQVHMFMNNQLGPQHGLPQDFMMKMKDFKNFQAARRYRDALHASDLTYLNITRSLEKYNRPVRMLLRNLSVRSEEQARNSYIAQNFFSPPRKLTPASLTLARTPDVPIKPPPAQAIHPQPINRILQWPDIVRGCQPVVFENILRPPRVRLESDEQSEPLVAQMKGHNPDFPQLLEPRVVFTSQSQPQQSSTRTSPEITFDRLILESTTLMATNDLIKCASNAYRQQFMASEKKLEEAIDEYLRRHRAQKAQYTEKSRLISLETLLRQMMGVKRELSEVRKRWNRNSIDGLQKRKRVIRKVVRPQVQGEVVVALASAAYGGLLPPSRYQMLKLNWSGQQIPSDQQEAIMRLVTESEAFWQHPELHPVAMECLRLMILACPPARIERTVAVHPCPGQVKTVKSITGGLQQVDLATVLDEINSVIAHAVKASYERNKFSEYEAFMFFYAINAKAVVCQSLYADPALHRLPM